MNWGKFIAKWARWSKRRKFLNRPDFAEANLAGGSADVIALHNLIWSYLACKKRSPSNAGNDVACYRLSQVQAMLEQ